MTGTPAKEELIVRLMGTGDGLEMGGAKSTRRFFGTAEALVFYRSTESANPIHHYGAVVDAAIR